MPVASEEEEGEKAPAMTETVEEDGLKGSSPLSAQTYPRPVRRCLFGEVDHESNRRDAFRIREDLTMASKRKWNFDFENGCPLEGHYRWTRVQQDPQLSRAPSTTGPSDCPPSGEGAVGRVNFDLGPVSLDSSFSGDAATGTITRIGETAGDDTSGHAATRTQRRQPTLRNEEISQSKRPVSQNETAVDRGEWFCSGVTPHPPPTIPTLPSSWLDPTWILT